jgi:MFS family permease
VSTTPTARDLLRDRAVVALLLASLAATTAALVQVTALGKQLYDITGRDLDLGLLGLAEFLPAVVLVAVTGTVADRYDRRRIVGLGLVGEAVASGGLAWNATSGSTSTWPIFTLVVLFGAARAFVTPALRSMPPDIAPVGGLPRLIAFSSAGWQTALIVGPVLAGFLYVVSPAAPFVACVVLTLCGSVIVQFTRPRRRHATAPESITDPDSAVFVELADEARAGESLDAVGESYAGATAAAIGSVEPPRPRKGRWHEAFEGLRVIRTNPVLLGAISLDLFAVLFGGAVALLPALAANRYGVGAVGLGWLRAATGIGAAAVTIWLSARPIHRHIGRTLYAVVALFGVFTIVLGLTRSFAVAFVALMLLSAADSVSVFIRSTLVPLVTPSPSRGRVMAVEGIFVGASNELGAFESGVAGQLIGTSGAVVFGGFATLAVVGGWTVLFPALGRMDRFPDRPPD